MANASQVIGEFVESIQGVDDLDVLKDRFMDSVEPLGINNFSYHIVRAMGFTEEMVVGLFTYPDEWKDRYIDANYVQIDPVIDTGRRSTLPFTWPIIQNTQSLEDHQRQFMDEASEFGVVSGMSVPLHGHREFAMLSYLPGGNTGESQKILDASKHTLHLLSLYFHNHTRHLVVEQLDRQAQQQLTDREKECLKWTAAGKTAWEISQILSISERTVVYHLENAKHKLGVNSRPHAVVKAVMSGLIDVF